jgi:signal transduction histidine kinase
MCAADDSPDRFVHDAADQLRHDLFSPLTTISARTQLLARDLRRSPSLAEEERVKMLAGITAIEAEVRALCAVIEAMNLPSRDGQAAPADGER